MTPTPSAKDAAKTKSAQGPDTSDAIEATDTPAAPPRFVGIAASAGGLEAVSLLAQHLPRNLNAVYVVAQHMSPTHKSMLATLIGRETRLPVHEMTPETTPEADAIYVSPPNTDVIYEDGLLKLRQPSVHPASPKPSADRLFKSLVKECGEACVGIVLSGTGSDGSYGVQAIREAGGITIAQEPGTAKYDGMPTSALQTGCIDLTLAPDLIGTHLEKILARPRNFDDLQSLNDAPNPLGELFGILLARTHVDFRDYKENTLNRRIARRMVALDIQEYDDYVDYCRSRVDEVDALHRDLLISVTRFFRDPDQFDKLRGEMAKVLSRGKTGPLRIWVVGCATGEEAYSIAIMIAEILGGIDMLAVRGVQVFATDIDQNAIDIARKGVYPIAAASDIPAEYLANYFNVGETDITVRPELRAVTLFSHHNIFQDPPFINVDLVTIRNVLIYFNLALQERVLSRLHYALAAGGLLFVGTSETVGEMSVFFEARSNADKVFGKRSSISGELSVEPGARTYQRERRNSSAKSGKTTPALAAEADLSLARAVAPNGMICTRNGSIIEVLGDLSPFIEIRAGATTSLNVKMLIEPLRTEVTSLLSVAVRNETRRSGRWHSVSLPVGNRVRLQVFPFSSKSGGEMQCLVAVDAKFEEIQESRLTELEDADQRAYVERMELEIRSTQEALQQTIEELQTANEELQSTNEEMQSTNEEFQATNEELETSNEELQSTNEELLTVNEELQISSAERHALASELEAMMTTAPYAVALADQALIVRRLSAVAMRLFGLVELPPTGIHLSQCTLPGGFPALAPIANSVLRLQETRRIPILSEGKYYSMVLSPVHDLHRKLIGLSITVTQYDSEPLAHIVEMMGDVTKVAHWSYNLDTKDLLWSNRMFTIHGLDNSGEMPTWDIALSLIHPEDREAEMTAVNNLIRDGGNYQFERRAFGPGGRVLTMRGSTMLTKDAEGNPVQLIGVLWDTAEQTEQTIRLSNMENVHSDLGIGVFSFDVRNNQAEWNTFLFDVLGYNPVTHSPSVESLLARIHPDQRAEAAERFQTALTEGSSFELNCLVVQPDGSQSTCEIHGKVRRERGGRVSHVFGSVQCRASRDAEPIPLSQTL
ncbi:chemotaxis protein CheB [uncultured Tateyamaria sp.]|uniref:chemotaxis protein CheB n=1 Tax=uncultured Tateyamaria sp. TaxID=455651 RepID=UPI00260A5B9E|nr:chemotaxis protein CheB [uncultured Tateyamaria sp.]